MSNDENTCNNNDENNTMGLSNAVTAVTPVTDENKLIYELQQELLLYPTTMYRLYEGGDTWACNNCMDKGDKWYMKNHICKMNKKQ